MSKKNPIWPFLVILSIGVLSCSQSGDSKPPSSEDVYSNARKEATTIVKGLMDENAIPGLAIAVSIGDELVWSEGFGYSNLYQQTPVDPAKTMFRIGSVSKTLSASALGVLMESGKLDPDLPVQTYVPDFPKKKYPITVRQVAGHIAGVRHYRGNEMLSDKFYPTVSEGLEIFKEDSLLFEPGTDYSYSSYGWNLISAVVEGASGTDFLEFMSKKVFKPLDMKNTLADYANQDIPGRTTFYIRTDSGVVNAPYVDNSYKWAGGGFISTVEDLNRFGRAHMTPGFLEKETLKTLQNTQFLTNGDPTDYGMGWSSGEDERGKFFVGHTGGSIGGITQFWIYPSEELVIAVLTNINPVRYGESVTRIAWLFMETPVDR